MEQRLLHERLEFEGSDRQRLQRPVWMTLAVNAAQAIWHSVVDGLMGGSDLRVWQSRDRHGQLWWHLYDPKTGESAQVSSEEEALNWIEESYYRKPQPLEDLPW
ncbi:MAG TPA: hypothetical protein V6C88_05995 [Chroococcidiopsis sp.]